MGKGEIARNEQFLLFPQCFLLNQIIVSPFVYIFDIFIFAAVFEKPKISISGITAFENIVGKGEIARNEQFLLFPQCFLLKQLIVSSFIKVFAIISVFANELGEPKIDI